MQGKKLQDNPNTQNIKNHSLSLTCTSPTSSADANKAVPVLVATSVANTLDAAAFPQPVGAEKGVELLKYVNLYFSFF
jgi:hypothetical protein